MIHARGGIQVYEYKRLDQVCLEDPNAPPEHLTLSNFISGLGGPTAPRMAGGGINPQVMDRVIVSSKAPPERQMPRDDGASIIVTPQPTISREEKQDPRAHVVQGNRR
jgi:hypothetical protein